MLHRLISAIAISLAVSAHAAVIDFNGVPVTGTTSPIVTVGAPYLEDGFKLSTRGCVSFNCAGGTIYAITPANGLWSGSAAVYSGVGDPRYGSAFWFEKADGGLFDLISVDAAAVANAPNARAFNIYGYGDNGKSVSMSWTLDTSLNTLETLTLSPAFTGLRSVLMSAMYAQVDNINVTYTGEVRNPVPEPAALLLALAGVGCAIATRRRH